MRQSNINYAAVLLSTVHQGAQVDHSSYYYRAEEFLVVIIATATGILLICSLYRRQDGSMCYSVLTLALRTVFAY